MSNTKHDSVHKSIASYALHGSGPIQHLPLLLSNQQKSEQLSGVLIDKQQQLTVAALSLAFHKMAAQASGLAT